MRVIKPEKRGSGAKLTKRLIKTAGAALDTLEEILTDEGVKAGDKLAAVKLTFDILKLNASEDIIPESGPVRAIVIDGIEPPLCG